MPRIDPVGVLIALALSALVAGAFWWMLRQPPPPRRARKGSGLPVVVVPVTDLPATERAVELACRLDGAAEVLLLHVTILPFTMPLDVDLSGQDRDRRELLALGRIIARRAGKPARERSIRDRDLAGAVLRIAEEEGARAIVLGFSPARVPCWTDWGRAAARIQREAGCEVIVDTARERRRAAPGDARALAPAVPA